MKITSEKKIAASRANGARSRGPVTPESKARSSRNALRHGLRSKTIALPADTPEALSPLIDSYSRSLAPRNQAEREIVTGIVLADLRHRRALRLEAEMLDSAMSAVPNPSSGLDCLATAFSQLAQNGRFNTVFRYQVRYSNISHHLLLQHLELRRLPALDFSWHERTHNSRGCNTRLRYLRLSTVRT
jgi:hypothetical protein